MNTMWTKQNRRFFRDKQQQQYFSVNMKHWKKKTMTFPLNITEIKLQVKFQACIKSTYLKKLLVPLTNTMWCLERCIKYLFCLLYVLFPAFPGGNVDYKLKQTICVKSHLSLTDHIKEFEGGAVILIRNPYSAIVAEVFRRFMFEKEESAEDAMKYFKSKGKRSDKILIYNYINIIFLK